MKIISSFVIYTKSWKLSYKSLALLIFTKSIITWKIIVITWNRKKLRFTSSEWLVYAIIFVTISAIFSLNLISEITLFQSHFLNFFKMLRAMSNRFLFSRILLNFRFLDNFSTNKSIKRHWLNLVNIMNSITEIMNALNALNLKQMLFVAFTLLTFFLIQIKTTC